MADYYQFECRKCGHKFKYHKLRECPKCGSFGIILIENEVKKMNKEKWKNFKDLKPFKQRKQPTFKYPDKKVLQGKIIDEIRIDNQIIDENTAGKTYVNLFQKIKLEDGRDLFRFCYYYINFDNDKPRWIFGQYALALLEKEYKELIRKMSFTLVSTLIKLKIKSK